MSDAQTAPRTEAELKAVLEARTGPMSALSKGASLAARTAAVGFPVAVAYGLVSGTVGQVVLDLATRATAADPAMVSLGAQITGGLGAFASLYAVLQFMKRATVSRASWWPALFGVPLLLVSGGLLLVESGQARQLGPVVLSMFAMGWSILFSSFGGAAAAVIWLRSGQAAMLGRSTSLAELVDEARSRTLDVAGPHGARVHAVTIGMQLLLPGIFYATQLAFTDMVAVLDPDRPALARSGQLTQNIRGKLFRLLFVWWLVSMAASTVVALLMEGAIGSADAAMELVFAVLIDPAATSGGTFVVQELIWALTTWVLELALLVLYVEREEQVKARNELKRLREQASPG